MRVEEQVGSLAIVASRHMHRTYAALFRAKEDFTPALCGDALSSREFRQRAMGTPRRASSAGIKLSSVSRSCLDCLLTIVPPDIVACMLQIAERKKLHQNLMNRLKKEPAAATVSPIAQYPFTHSQHLASCKSFVLRFSFQREEGGVLPADKQQLQKVLSECRMVSPIKQHQSRSNSSNGVRTSCIRLRRRSSKSSSS